MKDQASINRRRSKSLPMEQYQRYVQKIIHVSSLEKRFCEKLIMGLCYFTSAKLHNKDQSQNVFDMFFM
jgi:hypothetical protein